MTNHSDVQIFGPRGKMLPLDQIETQLAEAGDDVRARFEVLRAAYIENQNAIADARAADQRVIECATALRDAEAYQRKHFPPLDPVKLIQDHIRSQRAQP